MRPGPKPINGARAIELRKRGFTFREVGILLADEEGRCTRYDARSIKGAVDREWAARSLKA